MPTTKYKLAEQIGGILRGSDLSAGSSLELPEIMELVGQVINGLLKTEQYNVMNEMAATGSIVPTGLVIATYDNVAVSAYKTDYSIATLPATPVRLPKGMGVFHIGGVNSPFDSYIPVEPGMLQMVSGEPLISDVLGQVAYEVHGNSVVFNKNLTTQSPAVTAVFMRLVVMDISAYSDFDPLPIPADMEEKVITGVLKILGMKQEPASVVDPVTDNKGGAAQ